MPAVAPLLCRNTPCSASALCEALKLEHHGEGIYTFDLLTPVFCDALVAEIVSYEASALPRRRPNTMNRGGLVVNDVGMEDVMSELVIRLVAPLAELLYKGEPFARSLDHHHSFVVAYCADNSLVGPTSSRRGMTSSDRGLDMHHDASEVTLNVCLGKKFEGGGLRFCGQFGSSAVRKNHCVLDHRVGTAVMHLGRQRHGANDLTSGERLNLIVWARSSAFRAAAAFGHILPQGFPKQAEAAHPDVECLSQANDPDYAFELRKWQIRAGIKAEEDYVESEPAVCTMRAKTGITTTKAGPDEKRKKFPTTF